MSKGFEQGIKYIAENMSTVLGSKMTNLWFERIEESINILEQDIIKKASQYNNMGAKQLQGFVAETWHQGTFNISAVKNSSFTKAKSLDSNKFASVDIKIGKKRNSLKYYKDAVSSLKAQSETPYQRYKKDTSKDTQEEFLRKRNIKKEDIHKSMYEGQAKVIPTEQLLEAKDLIARKIAKEEALGHKEQVIKLKEIDSTLTDIVKDKKGNKSIPLSREHAQKLTEVAKKGKIEDELLKKCGLDVNNLISGIDILKHSLKAGLSGAMLAAIITIAPIIINGIEMLISKGEIDRDLFKEAGYTALDPAAKSFIMGTITAALIATCKTGELSTLLIDVNPTFISTSVVLVVGILENSIKYINGKITKAQMAEEVARTFAITVFSTGAGTLASMWFAEVPPLATLAYMLGSFLGGMIGQLVYNNVKNIFMSFCIENDFTFFGIVDQNYELPEDIMQEIGMEVFNYEKFDYTKFEYDSFEFERFVPEEFEYDKYEITVLRRGVIGIGKIGYIYRELLQ